jgi:hypothetical protein
MSREETPARVPGEDPGRQAGDDLWENYGAARGVWSKPMLMALEKGVKGMGAQRT